jgi:hypothetical protein
MRPDSAALDSVTFETGDLVLEGENANLRQWHTAEGDFVLLLYFAKPPDIVAKLTDIDALRAGYRAVAMGSGGAILGVDVVSADGCPGVSVIMKVPQQPSGMIYTGSLTLPFRDFSYVVMVQCAEGNFSGVRDTVVLNELVSSGEVKFGDQQEQPSGWWADPYDPAVAGPPARNMSELPRYDAQFPAHALSRLRRILPRLTTTLRVADSVKQAPRFEG